MVEVYRGNQKAERHFGIYSLYVMFYPQLVAGPIERPQNLLHQFYEHHRFEYQRVADGLKLMAWGLFKKVVIADRLAVVVNTIYADPTAHTGVPLILAGVFFAVQIYCDFSGYSDMAIGAAQAMGFRLMDNFRRPFASRSISEFWTRWHISLSSWFRDYVYIPLGGSRLGPGRQTFNLMVTFVLSGLWHGANWTYVIWGGLNGLMIVVGSATLAYRNAVARTLGLQRLPWLRHAVQVAITFSLFVFGVIIFRSTSMSEAWYIITHLFDGFHSWWNKDYWKQALSYQSIGLDDSELRIAFFSIVALEVRARGAEPREYSPHARRSPLDGALDALLPAGLEHPYVRHVHERSTIHLFSVLACAPAPMSRSCWGALRYSAALVLGSFGCPLFSGRFPISTSSRC